MVGRRETASPAAGRPASVPPEAGAPAGPPAEVVEPPVGFGRRLAGIALDWALSLALASAFLAPIGRSVGPLLVLLLEHTVFVGLFGASLGHACFGLKVERVDGRPAGIGRAALRSLLLCLAVPPLIMDGRRRGLHDKAAGTQVVFRRRTVTAR